MSTTPTTTLGAPSGLTGAAARQQARSVRARRPYPGFRIVGGLVAVLMILGSVLSTAPSLMKQQLVRSAPLTADLQTVAITAYRGDVTVRELQPGGAPRVQSDATWTLRQPELVLGSSGGTASIDAPCPGGNLGICWVDLEVWVPAGTEVEVRSSFGSVDVDTTATVEVTSGVGDVAVSGAPQSAELITTLGGVRLESARAPDSVRVRTTLGDVDIEVPGSQGYAVRAESRQSTPEVSVEVRTDSPYVIDVETTLGHIVVDQFEPASG